MAASFAARCLSFTKAPEPVFADEAIDRFSAHLEQALSIEAATTVGQKVAELQIKVKESLDKCGKPGSKASGCCFKFGPCDSEVKRTKLNKVRTSAEEVQTQVSSVKVKADETRDALKNALTSSLSRVVAQLGDLRSCSNDIVVKPANPDVPELELTAEEHKQLSSMLKTDAVDELLAHLEEQLPLVTQYSSASSAASRSLEAFVSSSQYRIGAAYRRCFLQLLTKDEQEEKEALQACIADVSGPTQAFAEFCSTLKVDVEAVKKAARDLRAHMILAAERVEAHKAAEVLPAPVTREAVLEALASFASWKKPVHEEPPREEPQELAKPDGDQTSASTAAEADAPVRTPTMNSTITNIGAGDPRFDFGPALLTRCNVCKKITLNRGDESTRKVYCLKCFVENVMDTTDAEAFRAAVQNRKGRA